MTKQCPHLCYYDSNLLLINSSRPFSCRTILRLEFKLSGLLASSAADDIIIVSSFPGFSSRGLLSFSRNESSNN